MLDKALTLMGCLRKRIIAEMLTQQKERGGADKNLDPYRNLKGDIDVFRRTEGKGAMYLSSDRICYRYSASTVLPFSHKSRLTS